MMHMRRKNISEKIHVELSRGGWRKLAYVNRELGVNFIRAFILKCELSAYLEMHEAAGIPLDTQFQELRYDDGICIIIRKIQGIWYITDIWMAETAVRYIPLFVWKKVKKGCQEVLGQILTGWQALKSLCGEKSFSGQGCFC